MEYYVFYDLFEIILRSICFRGGILRFLSTVIIRVGFGTPGYTGAVLFMLSAALAACVLGLSQYSTLSPDESE